MLVSNGLIWTMPYTDGVFLNRLFDALNVFVLGLVE